MQTAALFSRLKSNTVQLGLRSRTKTVRPITNININIIFIDVYFILILYDVITKSVYRSRSHYCQSVVAPSVKIKFKTI